MGQLKNKLIDKKYSADAFELAIFTSEVRYAQAEILKWVLDNRTNDPSFRKKVVEKIRELKDVEKQKNNYGF